MMCVVSLGRLWVDALVLDGPVVVVVRGDTGIQDPQVVQWIQGDPPGRVRAVYEQVPPRGCFEGSCRCCCC